MDIDRKLGKITKVRCGMGGYHDAMIGIGFTISGAEWSVSTNFDGTWAHKRSPDDKWTEESRLILLGEIFMDISRWLKEANVKEIYELKGKPVECTFDGLKLVSWRILTEVL